MSKSVKGCLGGAALIASLTLNVALIAGCISINGEPPFVHLAAENASKQTQIEAAQNKDKERNASLGRLREIAQAIGLDMKVDANEDSIKGEIIQRLLDAKVSLPSGKLDDVDLARIDEQLMKNKEAVKDACKFVMKLKGKKVLVLEEDK